MKSPSRRILGITALITGATSLCLLILPYVFFPQFYVAKANAATGYTAPATVEGWAFMIAGLSLLAVTVVCAKLRKQY